MTRILVSDIFESLWDRVNKNENMKKTTDNEVKKSSIELYAPAILYTVIYTIFSRAMRVSQDSMAYGLPDPSELMGSIFSFIVEAIGASLIPVTLGLLITLVSKLKRAKIINSTCLIVYILALIGKANMTYFSTQ